MEIEKTKFSDVLVLTPKVWSDDRGYFYEVFHKDKFIEAGLPQEFVQDNLSYSKKGVLRGMHFQWNPHQGKLVRTVLGKVYDVVIDIKRGSPTFGQWFGIELSDENHKMLWVPPGYAHGFLTLSDEAIFEYKCTGMYSPGNEGIVRYDDPEINIDWPKIAGINEFLLAPKDAQGATFAEWQKTPEFETFNDSLPV